jgi:hypothetical protein
MISSEPWWIWEDRLVQGGERKVNNEEGGERPSKRCEESISNHSNFWSWTSRTTLSQSLIIMEAKRREGWALIKAQISTKGCKERIQSESCSYFWCCDSAGCWRAYGKRQSRVKENKKEEETHSNWFEIFDRFESLGDDIEMKRQEVGERFPEVCVEVERVWGGDRVISWWRDLCDSGREGSDHWPEESRGDFLRAETAWERERERETRRWARRGTEKRQPMKKLDSTDLNLCLMEARGGEEIDRHLTEWGEQMRQRSGDRERQREEGPERSHVQGHKDDPPWQRVSQQTTFAKREKRDREDCLWW